MSPAFALLRHTLLTRDSVLLWLFWLALIGLGTLMANRSSSILVAPMFVAFPTLFIGWQFGSRLWQLDREAVRGLLPGRAAALGRAALLSIILFALLPASLLWICSADFMLSFTLLAAALFSSACLPLMAGIAVPLMAVIAILWMSRYGRVLAGIDGVGYTIIFSLQTVVAVLGLVKRWRPLQSEKECDAGLLTPFVLGPHANGRHLVGELAPTTAWWQERSTAANVVLGDAGPQHPTRALAILLGPPLAPLRAVARLREASWFLLILAIPALSGKKPAGAIADLLPLLAIMLTLIVGLQGLLRIRHEWRHGSALFADARLLPGPEPQHGVWQRLFGMLLARLLGFAAIGSMLILAGAWLGPHEFARASTLALVPPWLALICVLLLPAVIAGRGLHLVAWAVLAGVNLFAVTATVMAWGGRLDGLDPMRWPSYGIAFSAIAALAGLIGWLAGGRRRSPFVSP